MWRALIDITFPNQNLTMPLNTRNTTRMTGMDQVVWNLTRDEDLFCIWGLATLEEPLKDDLIINTLKYLIKIIPILNSKPIVNWLSGKWRFLEKENVEDLISRINSQTDEAAHEQLKQVFLNPIDATAFSMIRIISIDGPMKHFFVIQVHHLVVDGEGLKRICVKFAEIYQQLYKNKDWKPSETLDPCRSWWQIARNFNARHVWLILKASFINSYRIFIFNLGNRTRFHLMGDRNADAGTGTSAPLYFESIRIEQESMLKLKAFAKRQGVTVNDIFMSSLALATLKWNTDRGDSPERLGFGYTANLRRWWGEPKGTLGNFSVVLAHEETRDNLETPAAALACTKRKVDRIKTFIGLDVFLILMQLKMMPYCLVSPLSVWLKKKLIAFLKNCHAMTNIGIVFEEAGDFGHTKAIDYSFLAPTFPGGFTIYTITTYKNVTTIHLRYSEDFLEKVSATSFLHLWKQMMVGLMEIGIPGF